MFKFLTLALISLVGMEYSTTAKANPRFASETPVNIIGGTNYYDISNNFILPSQFLDYYYQGPEIPSGFPVLGGSSFGITFRFHADYVYFKNGSSSNSTMIDSRDLSIYQDIDYYLISTGLSTDGRFTWLIDMHDVNGVQLRRDVIAYISYADSHNGLEILYNQLGQYCMYVSNFSFIPTGFDRNFTVPTNDGSTRVNVYDYQSYPNLPFTIDTRFRSIEQTFYFSEDIHVYDYWFAPFNTYWINALGEDGTTSRPIIFDGFFKNQGNYYSKYQFDGENHSQPPTGSAAAGWYFGPLGISSLSQALRPATGTLFWYAYLGLFTTFSNRVTPVWFTQYTEVTSGNVAHFVCSNVNTWYSIFYQEIYVVYEVVDTTGNLTMVHDQSYWDMLQFNYGYNPNPNVDTNAFTNALSLLGIAFGRLWSIGNIVLFGTITLNALILVPIIISIMLFIIKLLKRG